MSDNQCFACLAYLPSELTLSSKRVIASTLNNFQIEIKDLMELNGIRGDLDKNNDEKGGQLVHNLSVCLKCLIPLKRVVSSKSKVDKVESSVRKLQVDLLKQLKKLEKCLEGLRGEMEVIGGIIQDSGGGGSQATTDNDNGLSIDVSSFRKDVLDVKGRLQDFKIGISNSTTTANFPNSQTNSPNPSEILIPPLPTSIQIKTEPDTNQLNLTNFDEDSTELNLMDFDDHDYFDSPPSDTEADAALPPPPPTSPEIKPGSPVDSSKTKTIPRSKRKYSRVPNKCALCSKTFTLKTSLEAHVKKHHPNDRLQETVSCPHCQETMSRQILRTHKLHHCPSLKKNKPINFPCIICKENFTTVESLKDHNLEEHIEKLKHMCETCGKISVSRQANEMHQNTHKDPRNRETVECQDCGKMILTSSTDSHKRYGCPKRENSSFLCKFCKKYFSNESNLGKHIRRMHKGQKMNKGDDEDGVPKELIGPRRKIKVIAEEDNHDNLEQEEDKPDDKEEMEDSGSEFVPSEGDDAEEITKRKSRRGRRQGPIIKCPKCPRTFTWALALKKHKMAHHKNDWLLEPEHCPHCLEKMPRKLLRTHQFYHCPVKSKDTIYSCTLCKPSADTEIDTYQQPIFPDLQSLKSHVATQHPKKNLALVCDICGLISKCMHSHHQHQVRHVDPRKREFVNCDDCGKSILSTSLGSHKRLGCPKRERTSFPCIYCNKMFSAEMAVVRHVNRWHTGTNGELILKPRRPKVLQCHLCGKWIQDKSAMRRHLKSGHHQPGEERDDKIVCEFCGKEMFKVSLLTHERYHCPGKEREKEERVTCEICGKGFKSRSILQWHNKVNHGSDKFVCEICGKVFPVRNNYKKHMERHKGIKRFVCELGCGTRFTDKAHLKRHLEMKRCLGGKGPRKMRRSNLEIAGGEGGGGKG